jgi:hypothetical protein
MSGKFKIESHTMIDKSFKISNDEITLYVDYDDVDHKTVDRMAKGIVKALNGAGCSKCSGALALVNQYLTGRVYANLDDALRNLLQAFVTLRDNAADDAAKV